MRNDLENIDSAIHMINNIEILSYLSEDEVDILLSILDSLEKSVKRQMAMMEVELMSYR